MRDGGGAEQEAADDHEDDGEADDAGGSLAPLLSTEGPALFGCAATRCGLAVATVEAGNPTEKYAGRAFVRIRALGVHAAWGYGAATWAAAAARARGDEWLWGKQ